MNRALPGVFAAAALAAYALSSSCHGRSGDARAVLVGISAPKRVEADAPPKPIQRTSSAGCPRCPNEPLAASSDCALLSTDDATAVAIDVVTQSYREAGRIPRLPFLQRIPAEFHPDQVEESVEDWEDACLPDGAVSVLRCSQYPCRYAVGLQDLSSDCLDALPGTIANVSHAFVGDGAGGFDDTPTPAAVTALFRDPTDSDYLSLPLDDYENGIYRRWLREASPETFEGRGLHELGLLRRVRRRLWDETQPTP